MPCKKKYYNICLKKENDTFWVFWSFYIFLYVPFNSSSLQNVVSDNNLKRFYFQINYNRKIYETVTNTIPAPLETQRYECQWKSRNKIPCRRILVKLARRLYTKSSLVLNNHTWWRCYRALFASTDAFRISNHLYSCKLLVSLLK